MDGAVSAVADRMKVFVSYSRDDLNFADQLVLALADKGFDPILDRHSIDAAEKWRERLGKLIASADTVVFVLTAHSAGSSICAWEIEEAARLGKRMIAVIPYAFEGAPPIRLAELNWIFFYPEPKSPGSGFYDGVQKLERALKVDLTWLRQQTRFTEDAGDWLDHGRPGDMLLRGSALEEGLAWSRRIPAGAAMSPVIREFFNQSEEAEEQRKAATQAALVERERGVKDKEEALEAARVAQGRLRKWSVWALAAGFLLLAIAIPSNYFATTRSLDANDRRAAQFALAAQQIADQNDYARTMLMALAGDPAVKRGLLERAFRGEGNPAPRLALVRGYTHNNLVRSADAGGMVPLVSAGVNGAMYVGLGSDRTLNIWRLGDAKPLRAFTETSPDLATVGLWPDGGGYTLVTPNGQVSLWKSNSATPLRSFDAPGGDSVEKVAASSNGDFVVIGRKSGAAELWRAADATLIQTFPPSGEELVSLGVSDDGKTVMTAFNDRGFSFWSVGQTWRQFIRLDDLIDAVLSPDGLFVIAMSGTNATLWQAGFDFDAQRFDYKRERSIMSAAFSKDSRSLLLGLRNGTTLGWIIGNREPQFSIAGHNAAVMAVAFFPNVRQFLTASLDRTIKQWDQTGQKPVQTFRDRPSYYSVAFSPRGDQVLLASDKGTDLWRIGDSKPLQTFGSKQLPFEVTFHPDGRHIVTAGNDTLKLWEIGKDEPVRSYSGTEAGITAIAVSPDGKLLVAGLVDRKVRIWNIEQADAVNTLSDEAGFTAVAISPDSKQLLTGSTSGSAKLWKLDGKTSLRSFESADNSFASNSVAFSPDGATAFVGRSDDKIAAWRIDEDQKEPRKIYAGDQDELQKVDSIAFSPDGRFMLAATRDAAKLIDVKSGALLQTFSRNSAIASAAFSKDGKRVLVGTRIPFAYVWDVDPIVFARPSVQVRLACDKLKAIGMTEFTPQDQLRFPILSGEPQLICR
jgi:WD40 repeat protein